MAGLEVLVEHQGRALRRDPDRGRARPGAARGRDLPRRGGRGRPVRGRSRARRGAPRPLRRGPDGRRLAARARGRAGAPMPARSPSGTAGTASAGPAAGPTVSAQGGHIRRCQICDAQHFPRSDPAVIVLVTHRHPEHGERCLLGRSARFPAGIYSTLAGFVEPGESLEETVRREIYEEAGVEVVDLHYRSSQPWPFPASLMIGFRATAQERHAAPRSRRAGRCRLVQPGRADRPRAPPGPAAEPRLDRAPPDRGLALRGARAGLGLGDRAAPAAGRPRRARSGSASPCGGRRSGIRSRASRRISPAKRSARIRPSPGGSRSSGKPAATAK